MSTQVYAEAYARFYEKLSPKSTKEEYGVFFDNSSKFEDPFQKVEGLNAIHKVFVNMYETLHNPHFVVDEIVCSEDVAYLKWHFFYAYSEGREEEHFVGVSRVTFSKSAKVLSHVDYWDAAQHVYEKIPLLGSLIRFIKRKIHA